MSHIASDLTDTDLDRLVLLNSKATAGPWYVDRFDDDHYMSALGITTGCIDNFEERIAACLIQAPAYVIHDDGRWAENADFITASRNVFPELIRLARIGLKSASR